MPGRALDMVDVGVLNFEGLGLSGQTPTAFQFRLSWYPRCLQDSRESLVCAVKCRLAVRE